MTEETINTLCEKFHTTIDNLIPIYSKYMVTKDTISIIILLAMVIVCSIICLKLWRWTKTDDYDEYAVAPIVIGVCAAVAILICMIAIICNIYDLILWCNCPELRFLDTVLQIGD